MTNLFCILSFALFCSVLFLRAQEHNKNRAGSCSSENTANKDTARRVERKGKKMRVHMAQRKL